MDEFTPATPLEVAVAALQRAVESVVAAHDVITSMIDAPGQVITDDFRDAFDSLSFDLHAVSDNANDLRV